MKELFTLYYHRRILFTDFFSQSLKRVWALETHVNENLSEFQKSEMKGFSSHFAFSIV